MTLSPGGKPKRDGIRCPACASALTRVDCTTITAYIARRALPEGVVGVSRRRKCLSCSSRFTTLELPLEILST